MHRNGRSNGTGSSSGNGILYGIRELHRNGRSNGNGSSGGNGTLYGIGDGKGNGNRERYRYQNEDVMRSYYCTVWTISHLVIAGPILLL